MTTDCYNTDCPFRANETSNPYTCYCTTCQNRVIHDYTVITTDHTEPLEFAPIRHAHWFDVGSLSCRCSGCGCKNDRETAYCPNCGAKMQHIGNPDTLNTPQTHKEETHMYTKKFSSILDVIAHELSDEDLIRWVSQHAMESEANSREVAEVFGYECE